MELRQHGRISPNTASWSRRVGTGCSPYSVCSRGVAIRICIGSRGSLTLRITVWQDLGPQGRLYPKSWEGDYAIPFPGFLYGRMSLDGWMIDEVGLRKVFKASMSDYHKDYLKAIQVTKTQRTKRMA
jgi:hypothetical protein